jgi:hypothetical protein
VSPPDLLSTFVDVHGDGSANEVLVEPDFWQSLGGPDIPMQARGMPWAGQGTQPRPR